jgi:hypothetical protein
MKEPSFEQINSLIQAFKSNSKKYWFDYKIYTNKFDCQLDNCYELL